MCPLRSNAGSGRRGGVIFILALVLSLPILAVWLFRSRGRPPTGIRSLAVLAQLIQAPADRHLCAESYEGDLHDTLALHKKVASTIVDHIRNECASYETHME